MTIRIDWRRSMPILDRLYDLRLREAHPFNTPRAELPQQLVPAWLRTDREQLARFYWVLCLWMRGTGTMTATRGLLRVVEDEPRLLDPHFVLSYSQDDLIAALRAGRLPHLSKGNSKGWLENAQRLLAGWDGQVLKVAAKLTDYETAREILENRPATKTRSARGFYGYQKKMTSMLLYYLMYEELMPAFLFPVPIDYRVMRFCLSNQLVDVQPNAKGNYRSDELEDRLRFLFFEYARRTGANPLLLADAAWLYPGVMCAKHPGNFTRIGEYEARSTVIEPVQIEWTPAQRRAYEQTCGQCPFDQSCDTLWPYQYYYRRGTMESVPRERPPNHRQVLFVQVGET